MKFNLFLCNKGFINLRLFLNLRNYLLLFNHKKMKWTSKIKIPIPIEYFPRGMKILNVFLVILQKHFHITSLFFKKPQIWLKSTYPKGSSYCIKVASQSKFRLIFISFYCFTLHFSSFYTFIFFKSFNTLLKCEAWSRNFNPAIHFFYNQLSFWVII